MHGQAQSDHRDRIRAARSGEEIAVVDTIVSCYTPAGSRPGRPPQLDIIASFEDDRGRRVPVVIERRLAIERDPVLLESGGPPMELPICAWTFSVYDNVEPDPECLLTLLEDGTDFASRLPWMGTNWSDRIPTHAPCWNGCGIRWPTRSSKRST